jgi:hypothetical protein
MGGRKSGGKAQITRDRAAVVDRVARRSFLNLTQVAILVSEVSVDVGPVPQVCKSAVMASPARQLSASSKRGRCPAKTAWRPFSLEVV